ncbi:MAG: DNA adenine methylase [Terriglobales bacterium]
MSNKSQASSCEIRRARKTLCEPLLKWAGGKRRLLPKILRFVPVTEGRYFEPFLGGGAVFFSRQPKSALLSDSNPELINAYVQVRDDLGAVVRHLRGLPNSEADYYRIRASSPRSPAGRAARLIYLCTLSFNGIYRQNLIGEFNVPYGQKTHLSPCDLPKLKEISAALSGRRIEVLDFGKAVRRAKGGDVVYFDPPYTVAHGNNGFVKYNARIFSWADQVRLAKLARRLKRRGVYVFVSNADHPSIRKLYSGFAAKTMGRHSAMAASSEYRRLVRECLFF